MTRHPENVAPDAREEVLELLRQLRVASHSPSHVLNISDKLEVLTRAHLTPSVEEPFKGVNLTKMESRLVSALMNRHGGIVSEDNLLNAMYFDREEASASNIKVLFVRIRRKMADLPYVIENVWGQGYRLIYKPC
jgi:DNA-binding response OmpR family regulator